VGLAFVAVGLNLEVWGVIGTGGGAVVALLAAGFAFWQACIARGARDATIEQATIARDALELQRTEQHQRDAPDFTLTVAPAVADYSSHIELRMISGPPEIMAEIRYKNGWAERNAAGKVERRGSTGQVTTRKRMVRNFSTNYSHAATPNAAAIWSEVTIVSTEIGGDERTWRHVQRIDWIDPANPPW